MKILSFVSKRVSNLSWLQRARLWFKGADVVEYEREKDSAKILDDWMKSKGCSPIVPGSESFTISSDVFKDWDEKKEDEDQKKIKWFL